MFQRLEQNELKRNNCSTPELSPEHGKELTISVEKTIAAHEAGVLV
jgi:hypothetical protein